MKTLYSDKIATPGAQRQEQVPACDDSGKLRFVEFRLKVPERVDNPRLVLVKLPLGAVRIIGGLSRISTKFKDKDVSMDIGWLRYKVPLQHWEETNPTGLDKSQKSGNFTIGKKLPLQTASFTTQEGLEIAMFVNGTLNIGDEVHGYIIYVKD